MRKYEIDDLKVEEKLFEREPSAEEKLSAQARIIREMRNEMRELREQLRRYRRWNKDRARFLTGIDDSRL